MSKEKLNPATLRPSQLKEDPNKTMVPPQFKLDASVLQAKMGEAQSAASAGASTTMDAGVQKKMEAGVGADLSGVKVFPNSEKATMAGALAYTQGNEVHFAPGQYNPASQAGQELLGHELTHVKQQQEGKVSATGSVAGMPLNDDRKLESEADAVGKAAAAGQSAGPAAQRKEASGSSGSGPVQRFKMEAADIKKYPKFAEFLAAEVPKLINDARLVKYLNKYGTNKGETARDIAKDLLFGEGPLVKPWSLPTNKVSFLSNAGSETIRLSRNDISSYEQNDRWNEKFHAMVLEANIMNGYTQFLDDQDGKDLWGKEGKMMEKKTYGDDIESVADAMESSYARFAEGTWEVTAEHVSSDRPYRIKVWNSDKNGDHMIQPGTKMQFTTPKFRKLNFWVESNTGNVKDNKDWKRAEMIKAADGKDNFVVRAESGSDRGRNDVLIRVRRVNA